MQKIVFLCVHHAPAETVLPILNLVETYIIYDQKGIVILIPTSEAAGGPWSIIRAVCSDFVY